MEKKPCLKFFVGGIPGGVDHKQLYGYFKRFGTIKRIIILNQDSMAQSRPSKNLDKSQALPFRKAENPLVSAFTDGFTRQEYSSGQPFHAGPSVLANKSSIRKVYGFCFLKFKRLNGNEFFDKAFVFNFMGRNLEVEPIVRKNNLKEAISEKHSRKIFLQNIPQARPGEEPKITEETLRAYFEKFGKVSNCYIVHRSSMKASHGASEATELLANNSVCNAPNNPPLNQQQSKLVQNQTNVPGIQSSQIVADSRKEASPAPIKTQNPAIQTNHGCVNFKQKADAKKALQQGQAIINGWKITVKPYGFYSAQEEKNPKKSVDYTLPLSKHLSEAKTPTLELSSTQILEYPTTSSMGSVGKELKKKVAQNPTSTRDLQKEANSTVGSKRVTIMHSCRPTCKAYYSVGVAERRENHCLQINDNLRFNLFNLREQAVE